MTNIFIKVLERKRELLEEFHSLLSDDEILYARRDSHAFRRPRPCGLTVHTGVGCPYKCTYCYIYDMGFPDKISKYPLKPEALIYAILLNRYFYPTKYGTLIALGSVTEPFHPVTKEYTLECIKLISSKLGNPLQASTKALLDEDYVRMLASYAPYISILISIPLYKWSRILEPYAPKVELRFETMKLLSDYGIHVTLFFRPIIPHASEDDLEIILDKSIEAGVRRVIFGTLRISKNILHKFREYKEIYNLIIKRIKDLSRLDSIRFIDIYIRDLKDRFSGIARSKGFKVYPSACSANLDAYHQSCALCKFGPCNTNYKPIDIDEGDIVELMEYLELDSYYVNAIISNSKIKIIMKQYKLPNEIRDLITIISKRMVEVKRL